ncbi:MAG: hypothetical protein OK452_09235 [Thaumarchaeota archaeon]|nr:hypothetical protein [Nitrososphaerota archaeon]
MNTLIALANGAIARALQVEGEWKVEHPKFAFRVTCLSSGTSGHGPAYAGTETGSILVSFDGGASWKELGSVGKEVRSIAVAPSNPALLYAGTKPSHVFASEDSGQSWVELVEFRKIPWRWLWRSPAELPFTAYVQALAVAPTDPEIILAGIEFGAVVRSEDGGLTWQSHRRGAVRDCHNMIFHPRDGDWAYEAGGSGAAFSTDGGMTWGQPRLGLDRHYCWAVAANYKDPATWFVSASPGAFRAHSSDRAQAYIYKMIANGTWQRLGGGLPQPFNSMPYALATSQENSGEVYAGLRNGDVWHSEDGGDNWKRLKLNLGSIERTLIVI